MSDWNENIEKIVAKIEGDKMGNAFLIDRNRAVTVKHCITDPSARVKLVFPKIQESEPMEVWATVDEQFIPEEDELLLLKLEQDLPEIDISIVAMKIHPSDDAGVFGYDANYLALGRWTDLISAASVIPNLDMVQDMLFDAKDNRESDFSGLSGSPIVKGKHIIGIVSQETLEKSQAIAIHGISIRSCSEFWRRYGVKVTEFSDVGEYTFEPDLSIGSYRSTDKDIAIGGEQGVQGLFHGIYRDKLEKIVDHHHKGDVDGAWSELKEQIAQLDGNPYVGRGVKAEYYYRMALWFLEDRNDVGKAQKKYEKALEMDPDLDACIFHALKQTLTGECGDAEELLEPVDTASKFHVYLQICINARKIQKAYEKYEELDQVIPMDDTTYYLLSVMETLRYEYDSAMKYIENALEINERVPIYFLVKGIILYWKAIPSDVCVEGDFGPVLFHDGLLHLDEGQCQMLKEAGAAYHRAFQLADAIGNAELAENILSIWISSLSVDGRLQNDIMEPLHLLQEINKFNVTALFYMIQKKMELPEGVTTESLERHLKKSQNKLGYIIVLIELCIYQNELKLAKKFLYEYKSLFFQGEDYNNWYEYIVKVEDNVCKLKEYENEIKNDAGLDEVQRKRLLCLFLQLDPDKDSEMQEVLSGIYTQTNRRLDLLNLIFFCRTRRKWRHMLQYAERLSEQYNDVYGRVYMVQSLVELGEYDAAVNVLEELEENQIAGIEAAILHYKMVICERQGQYGAAIESGRKLLKEKSSEQLFLKLCSLYVLNGDDEGALHILLEAEDRGMDSVAVSQRISVCYMATDSRKAWEYAVNAVKLSENQPEVMLWATDIAHRTGRSDKAGEYLHHIMMNKSGHQLLVSKSIDEAAEMLRKYREETEKNILKLYEGSLPSHLFVDSCRGNQTYAEFFYALWENSNAVAPMEFGAHHYEEDGLPLGMKRIALDYSACLFLYELNLLEIFCEGLEQVFIAGNLFGVLSEEIRRIPVNQQDLIAKRYEMIEKCKTEWNVCFVESKYPAGLEELDVKRSVDMVHAYTAEYYGAVWVSDDGSENSVREIEVITVLYRNGKIPEDTFVEYAAGAMSVREEKIQSLYQDNICLYVEEAVLEKWNDFYLLPAVCGSYAVYAEAEAADRAEQEFENIAVKKHICERLDGLKRILLDLKEQGKLSFLPMEEGHEGMDYSNMLISLMIASEKRNLPMCVDDRVMTSYAHIGKAPVYNTFDIMKILYLSKKIRLEQYSSLWKRTLEKRISYVLPDNRFVLYALQLSKEDLEMHRLKESEMLSAIRKYVVEALSQGSYLSHRRVEHVYIPEWEYFVFNLQMSSRDLFRSVWRSDMGYGKMCLASEWILYHYSQFAFDFSGGVDEKRRKECHAIQLTDFLLEGLLMALNEELTEIYYKWLYDWFETYLKINPGIKEKIIGYTKEHIVSYLRKIRREGSRQEIKLTKWMFATGMYYMPEEYQQRMLEDKVISNMYHSVYGRISIVLDSEKQVPITLYNAWENEVLAMDEKEVLDKNFKEVCFQFSWEYILPAFPGVHITWEENSVKKNRYIFMDRGIRLKHQNRDIRRKELHNIEPYLEEFDYGKQILVLQSMAQYEAAAEEILCLLDQSEKYEILRIECGLKNKWLHKEDTRKLMLPAKPDYFKQLYDFDVDPDISTIAKDVALSLPLRFGEVGEEAQTRNHNPVRALHRFAMLLSAGVSDDDILAETDHLFSYVDDKEGKYGSIFIVLLKIVWKLFSERENYKNESYENRLIWTYIWADKILTCLTKLEKEGFLDVAAYGKQLGESADIDIRTDGMWDTTEDEDILSPVHMNLYRLCVTGTLLICSRYEDRMRRISETILDRLIGCYIPWISEPIHYRESELLHKSEKNIFGAIFTENCFFVIEKLAEMGNCKGKIGIDIPSAAVGNRMMCLLQRILYGKEAGLSELIYMFVISREKMEGIYADLVMEIIEKQVLGQVFQTDRTRHRLLAYILKELPENFQDKYLKHEFVRVGALLRTKEMSFGDVFDLVLEMIQLFDSKYFLDFWEVYADELEGLDALQMAERIGRLQLMLPLEYAERTRNLRMRFELKS